MIGSDQSKSHLSELVRLTNYNYIALGYQKLTVDGTVKSLTVPDGARYAVCIIESSLTTPAIRYLELGAGTPPSSTNGLVRSNLDAFDIQGYQNLINFRVTQVGTGTHTLHIQYYK